VPDVIRTEWERARPGFINFLTADLAKVRAHSAHDVALSAAEARYPIVMLGGGGSGTSGLSFSTLAEDLASHGYIVASVDAAAGRNPELCVGRADEEGCATAVMTPLVARIGQALDSLRNLSSDDARFKDRLDVVVSRLAAPARTAAPRRPPPGRHHRVCVAHIPRRAPQGQDRVAQRLHIAGLSRTRRITLNRTLAARPMENLQGVHVLVPQFISAG